MLRNALVTPLLTALVTGPLPNPTQPDPVLKTFVAESDSDRRLGDVRVSHGLNLTIDQGEAR